jgi:hypothetical protein
VGGGADMTSKRSRALLIHAIAGLLVVALMMIDFWLDYHPSAFGHSLKSLPYERDVVFGAFFLWFGAFYFVPGSMMPRLFHIKQRWVQVSILVLSVIAIGVFIHWLARY